MGELSRRVGRLEAAIPSGCAACHEHSRTIHIGEDAVPAACPGCGRSIEVASFTIAIDCAQPREGDAA